MPFSALNSLFCPENAVPPNRIKRAFRSWERKVLEEIEESSSEVIVLSWEKLFL